MKITLRYDPINGEAFPDGVCDEQVNSWIEQFLSENTEDYTCSFSTENILFPIRIAVKNGRIKSEQVIVIFKETNEIIEWSGNGRLKTWPIGFCDHYENWLNALLDW